MKKGSHRFTDLCKKKKKISQIRHGTLEMLKSKK
jgi:hypothetical protein